MSGRSRLFLTVGAWLQITARGGLAGQSIVQESTVGKRDGLWAKRYSMPGHSVSTMATGGMLLDTSAWHGRAGHTTVVRSGQLGLVFVGASRE